MVGLVLEGGGTKGSYQIGAYYAFKKCHIKFDGIVGTSIGAVNAAFLVAHQELRLLRFWQHESVGKILDFSPEMIDAVNKEIPLKEKIIIQRREIQRVLKNQGLSTKGLLDLLKNNLNISKFYKSKIDFGLNTVKLNGLKPINLFKADINEKDLYHYLIDSCYLPIFKMEKFDGESYYADGGFFDNSPSNMLIDKGYDKVYIIDIKGVGFKQRKRGKDKIITIKPSHNLGKILDLSKKQMKYNIKLGYYDTIKVLKNLDGFKYIFKVLDADFYNKITSKMSKSYLLKMKTRYICSTNKELVLKFLEEIFAKRKYKYTYIYDPRKEILKLKKDKKVMETYEFLRKLNI